jgi:2-polyprenyl-6-hydroxyphenyl methylase / 3-demethylubiquinone-9 3-methyltransferase
VADLDLTLDTCARLLKAGGILGFLTHNQTREAFDALIWEGEYQKHVIPKGTHDFHKFIRPADLDQRLRARNLGIVDLQGLRFDMDSGVFELVSETTVTYLGYAVADDA